MQSLKLKSCDMLHDTFFHGLDCTVLVDLSDLYRMFPTSRKQNAPILIESN